MFPIYLKIRPVWTKTVRHRPVKLVLMAINMTLSHKNDSFTDI